MDRPWNLKELDTTEQLTLSLSCCHEFYNPILTKEKENYEPSQAREVGWCSRVPVWALPARDV